MQLIIESADEKVIQTILELIRPLNVTFHQIKDLDVVSIDEQQRRIAIGKRFKNRLANRLGSYQASKYEWYEQ